MKGKVKMIADKGYGFLEQEDGSEDVFFHASSLKAVAFEDIKVGMEVVFDVTTAERGLKATSIELL